MAVSSVGNAGTNGLSQNSLLVQLSIIALHHNTHSLVPCKTYLQHVGGNSVPEVTLILNM
jgi:hypothetical protein